MPLNGGATGIVEESESEDDSMQRLTTQAVG
jgi:hypothetical protein